MFAVGELKHKIMQSFYDGHLIDAAGTQWEFARVKIVDKDLA